MLVIGLNPFTCRSYGASFYINPATRGCASLTPGYQYTVPMGLLPRGSDNRPYGTYSPDATINRPYGTYSPDATINRPYGT